MAKFDIYVPWMTSETLVSCFPNDMQPKVGSKTPSNNKYDHDRKQDSAAVTIYVPRSLDGERNLLGKLLP
jgi:hypothetical protein